MRSPFAHVLGTVEGGIEKIPGTQGTANITESVEPVASLGDLHGHRNIVVQVKDDPRTAPLREFLVTTVRSCQELYSTARRLGLPESSVRDKLPWHK